MSSRQPARCRRYPRQFPYTNFKQFFFHPILHDLADICRVLAGGDQRARHLFYNYQIVDTYRSDKIWGEMNVIPAAFSAKKTKTFASKSDYRPPVVSWPCGCFGNAVHDQIVPTEICQQAKMWNSAPFLLSAVRYR